MTNYIKIIPKLNDILLVFLVFSLAFLCNLCYHLKMKTISKGAPP